MDPYRQLAKMPDKEGVSRMTDYTKGLILWGLMLTVAVGSLAYSSGLKKGYSGGFENGHNFHLSCPANDSIHFSPTDEWDYTCPIEGQELTMVREDGRLTYFRCHCPK